MLRIALLFLALLASAYSTSTAIISVDGLTFNADVNVTASQSDSRFNFRETSLTNILDTAALYTSVEIDAQGNQNGGTAHVDTIVGVCFVPTNFLSAAFGSPSAYLAYFTADVAVDISNINLQSQVTGSAAIVGKVYATLEEVASTGDVVKTYVLKSRSWSMGDIQNKGPNGELKYVTYTSSSDNFDVDLTFAVSSVLGKLNVGDATVTPRNLESFIEIRNYPYGNVNNFLRLTIFLGHLAAKASTTFKGTQTIVAGSGNEQIYFKLAGDAVADGESVSVTVNGLEKSSLQPSDIDSTLFSGQLTASGDLQAEIRKVTVDFPKGAVKVSYDPAIGFGAPNAAGLLLPSFAALFLSVAVFFFVF